MYRADLITSESALQFVSRRRYVGIGHTYIYIYIYMYGNPPPRTNL